MTSRREFEGFGYHFTGYDNDCLLVYRWTNRPDDLKGQALTISKLLPDELRYGKADNLRNGEYPSKQASPKFRFRIIIEFDSRCGSDGIDAGDM